MTGHVFISYSRADHGYVFKLAQHLTSAGIPVWYDYEVAAGDRFHAVIQHKIDACASLVVILTPAAVASAWVDREISYALDEGKPIVPLLLAPCRPSLLLRNLNYEDVTAGQLPSARFITIIRDLIPTQPASTRAAPNPRPIQAPSRRSPAGIASTGEWATNVQYNAEHATVTLIDSQITLAMPTRGPVVPAQMPADTPLFTGRTTIRSDIEAAIAQAHIDAPNALIIVALSGKGGVGKTALAVHLAHVVRPTYPDGQLYVDLRGAGTDPADPGEVLASFLAALGYERSIPDDLDDRRSLYLSALSDRRVLVLLDNAADEAQVRLLLPGSAGCLALVTSRRWLAALDTAVVFPLEILDPPGAVDLLGKLAGGDRVAREPEAAAEIARLCGYLPLAVCIAGGRLAARRHWRLAKLAERLRDERRRLDELEVGDRAVRATFNLSYQSLHGDEQRVFRLLGLIDATDFPPWVAAALLGLTPSGSEDMLERLIEIQLLEPAGAAGRGGRYQFHDLVRAFARERAHAEEPEANRLAAMASMVSGFVTTGELAWAMAPANRPELRPSDELARWATQHVCAADSAPPGGVDWFRAERDGFMAAQRQAHRLGFWKPTWQLAEVLAPFFVRQAQGSESQQTKELGLDAARQAGDLPAEAEVLGRLSLLYLHRPDWDRAVDVLQRALDIYVELGDRFGETQSLLLIGVVRRDQGRFADAVTSFQRCLTISGRTASRLQEAATQFNLGFALREQGYWYDARTAFEQGLTVFRAVDDAIAQARILYGIAVIDSSEGRLSEALSLLAEAARLARVAVDDRWETIIQLGTGRVLCHKGQWQEGIAIFEQCLPRFLEIGDHVGEAHVLRSLGIVLRNRGFANDARARLGRSLAFFIGVGDRRGEARVRHSMGTTSQVLGEHDAARDHLARGLELSRAMDDRPWQARTLNRLGLLSAATHDWTAANEHWAQADAALDGLQTDALAAMLRRSRPST